MRSRISECHLLYEITSWLLQKYNVAEAKWLLMTDCKVISYSKCNYHGKRNTTLTQYYLTYSVLG